jgi:Tol biopolymer transport system component
VRRNEVGLPVTQTFVVELVNPNTGRITDLATAPKLDQSIALIGFSPHGEWLLFSQVDELAQPSLWVANTDGSGARMLVDGTSDAGWLSLP